MANLPSFFSFFVRYEEFERRIWWSYKFRQCFRLSKFAVTKLLDRYIAEHYTSYWQIHDYKVHEASLATVAGLGGDVIASSLHYLGHSDSQSEKA